MKRIFLCLLAAVMLCTSAAAEQIVLTFVGDCIVGDQYNLRWYPRAFTTLMTEKGLDYPFSGFIDVFRNDDITIANCEGVFTTRKLAKGAKIKSMCAPPYFAEVFALGDVEVCNITNNHGHDFGQEGREDTIEALTEYGVGYFGDKHTWIIEVKGVKIGFCGYTFPYTDQKMRNFQKRINELRDAGCTFIIASCHWGSEYKYNINSAQREVGTKLIDMGADLVYGHGPHVLHPLRWYNGSLIVYSMANFTFGADPEPNDDDTAVLQVVLDVNEDGTVTEHSLTVIPAKMHQNSDYRPWPIEDEDGKRQVWKKMYSDGSGKNPASGLPASFLETGYVDLTELQQEESAE